MCIFKRKKIIKTLVESETVVNRFDKGYKNVKCKGEDTGFIDKNNIKIKVGNKCKAFDKTGKEWIAKIEKREGNSIHNNGKDNIYVFASNYDTWLNKDYAKELEIIK